MNIHGIVVGIARPRRTLVGGQSTAFDPLLGVATDVASYKKIITGLQSQVADVQIQSVTDADNLGPMALLGLIAKHTENCDCDWLVVALVGHGVQTRTEPSPLEPDGFDENFVTSDGLLLDNDLGRVWEHARSSLRIAVFADTCHSESIGRRAFEPDLDTDDELRAAIDRHVTRLNSPGPSRVFLSAVTDDALARATDGVPVQGIFTRSLVLGWTASPRPQNFVDWHEATARAAFRRYNQMPTLVSDGQDDSAMYAPPFGLPTG